MIYSERGRVLGGEDLSTEVQHMLEEVVGAYVKGAAAEGYAEDWDLEQLWSGLKQLYPVGVTIEDIEEEAGGERSQVDSEFLEAKLLEDAQTAYAAREEELGPDAMREFERLVLLQVIDRKWREHLYEMDFLQEGIHLRAYSQRDPLVEYQREGYDMFSQMQDGIKEEVVGFLFNLEVQVEEAPPPPPVIETQAARLLPSAKPVEIRAKGLGRPSQPQALSYSSPTIDGAAGSGAVMFEQAPALGIGS